MSPTAVFLDRDGTIIEERGYIKNPSDVIFFPDTIKALKLLQENHLLFLITNQSGVGEGFLSISDVERVNRYIVKFLSSNGIFLKEIYCCPHTKNDGCICRKPQIYFIKKATELYGLDIENSFIIGDHPSDVEMAIKTNSTGIYVLTGHGRKHIKDVPSTIKIVEGILEAAHYITRIHSPKYVQK